MKPLEFAALAVLGLVLLGGKKSDMVADTSSAPSATPAYQSDGTPNFTMPQATPVKEVDAIVRAPTYVPSPIMPAPIVLAQPGTEIQLFPYNPVATGGGSRTVNATPAPKADLIQLTNKAPPVQYGPVKWVRPW